MSARQITIPEYIAYNNMGDAQDLLEKYNLGRAKNYPQLIAGLQYVIKHGREQGYADVINLHPDKEMILELFTPEKSSNACGCNGSACDGDTKCEECKNKNKTSSADGDPESAPVTRKDLTDAIAKLKDKGRDFAEAYPILLIGGVLVTLFYFSTKGK
jgi:hypothetical protein